MIKQILVALSLFLAACAQDPDIPESSAYIRIASYDLGTGSQIATICANDWVHFERDNLDAEFRSRRSEHWIRADPGTYIKARRLAETEMPDIADDVFSTCVGSVSGAIGVSPPVAGRASVGSGCETGYYELEDALRALLPAEP